MAELRSFIIGVTIAALVLGVAAVAFGAVGGGGDNSPSVKVLGTPPATRAIATATRPIASPSVAPSAAASVPPTSTALPTATRAPIVTATAQPQPTTPPAPTATPAGVSVATYKTRLGDLSAQVNYLLGNAGSPNLDSDAWKQNTLTAAKNVQGIAAALTGNPPPACAASAHGSVSSGASAASQAAGQVIAGINANDAGAVSQAAGGLSSANQSISQGITGVNSSC